MKYVMHRNINPNANMAFGFILLPFTPQMPTWHLWCKW